MADHSRPGPFMGIAFMVASTAILASKDGLAKTFLGQVGPLQTIWIQYAFMFVILAAIAAPKEGWRAVMPEPLSGQFVRGALSAASIASLYWALTYIPLADATAMFLFAPTVVTLLSPLLLGETIDAQRKVAVAVGFAGVLIILKPGFGGNPAGYAIGLLAGVLMGLHYIANRKLAGTQTPLLNVTHNALMGALALSLFAPLFWETPPMSAGPKLMAFVVLAVLGQGLMITSFMFAPAPVIAPYSYAMLVFAALIGYVVFGDLPDLATWLGIFLIIGSGVFIAWRERKIALGRG